MLKVSIIVPIYKVENYLDECVQSVLNQTYQNLEILLVDDGSPDKCPEMCDSYASKDSRIRVIHQKNGGLSAARNSGMKVATGDYFYFLDSDDKIYPNAIEVMMNKVNAHPNLDVVVASTINQNNTLLHNFSEKIFPEYTNDKDWIHQNFCTWNICLTAWNKLYRRGLIKDNNLVFPEGLIHEDVYWSYFLQKHVCSISFVKDICYWYRWGNEDSITNDIDKTKSCLAHLKIIEVIEKEITDKYEVEFLKKIASFNFWSVYFPLSKDHKRIKKRISDIYNNIKNRKGKSLFLNTRTIINTPSWMICDSCFYIYRGYKKILSIGESLRTV